MQYLGNSWYKFGIEPSQKVAALAQQRGVTLLGSTLDDLSPETSPFDAILVMDVVEHVVDPLWFFRQLSNRLRPGGICIILTGDTDTWPWRMHGSRYWYCSIPEHVSFYNLTAMNEVAARADMCLIEHQHTSHKRFTAEVKSVEAIKNVIYLVGNRLHGLGWQPLKRLFVDRRTPCWQSTHDHMLHVMKRL